MLVCTMYGYKSVASANVFSAKVNPVPLPPRTLGLIPALFRDFFILFTLTGLDIGLLLSILADAYLLLVSAIVIELMLPARTIHSTTTIIHRFLVLCRGSYRCLAPSTIHHVFS